MNDVLVTYYSHSVPAAIEAKRAMNLNMSEIEAGKYYLASFCWKRTASDGA